MGKGEMSRMVEGMERCPEKVYAIMNTTYDSYENDAKCLIVFVIRDVF